MGICLILLVLKGKGKSIIVWKIYRQTVELTVDDVEEDVDLTLPENRSYQEDDFFERMFRENR